MTKLVDIETLGVALVERGANRKKFGVKKNDENGDGTMTTTVAQLLAQIIQKGELPMDDASFAAMCQKVGLSDPQAVETAKALIKLASAYKDNNAFEKFVTEVMPQALGLKSAAPGDAEPDPKAFGENKEPAKGEPAGDKAPAPGDTKPSPPAAGDLPSGGNKPPPEQTSANAGNDPSKKKEPPMSTQKDDKTQAGADKGAGDGAATTAVQKSAEVIKLEELLKSQQTGFSESLAKMQKGIDDANDRMLLKEWTSLAKSDLKFIPGKTFDELGKSLFELEKKVSKEFAQAQFEMMKASSTVMEKSALFSPAGVSPRPATSADGKDALSQIAKSAAVFLEKSDILKSDFNGFTGATLTEIQKAASVVKALEANPELYAMYLRENPAQAGDRYKN